ncbi:response regulator transcription factor [Roseivirga sp. E12]|uniref:response regulator transcription factor n=1 Tax=Roseivirga sp. E12 TaxID=2819237 RepID=UPI001ABCA0A5|nr:response regulator transcription factor [Roseivirga sp. E12]MBO3699884.1 response regulator transcription factor [Roseivirga sp. E12]
MSENIRLNIVEDDPEIRSNLALIINTSEGMICDRTFENAESFLENLELQNPDIVLMDISLPGITGIKAVEKMKEKMPNIEALMLTVHQDDQLVFDSLCAGASGYLVKSTPPQRIIEAIREAMSGGAPMSTSIARMVVKSFRKQTESDLTEREMDVLDQLCKGKSYKLIADALFISQDTVRSHIKSIYKKLEVNSKSEAVAKALKDRLV